MSLKCLSNCTPAEANAEDDENRRPAPTSEDQGEDGFAATKKGRKKKEPESWTLSGRWATIFTVCNRCTNIGSK